MTMKIRELKTKDLEQPIYLENVSQEIKQQIFPGLSEDELCEFEASLKKKNIPCLVYSDRS